MRTIAPLIVLALVFAESVSAQDSLVDIGGRRLHLSCTGTGSPTVILEAGMGDSSATWKAVQPAAAEVTRVCAYDRAGRGTSDPDPRKEFRTSRAAVEDLGLLLRAAKISGPYILVGHSLGGAYIRLYARRHPNDVAAMVLVDASHEEQFARWKATGLPVPVPPAGQNSERIDMSASLVEVGQEPWRADIPLVVLAHGRTIADALPNITAEQVTRIESVWLELQRELVSRSSQGRLVVAQKSGHYVQDEEPELVIAAIREVVAAVRRTASPR